MTTLPPQISIIIPVLNEEFYIKKVLQSIFSNSNKNTIKEILVVDGGSTDASVSKAKTLGAKVILSTKGRAAQMNLGAKKATGEILYFLHVDTLLPMDFDNQILEAVRTGHDVGCFQMKFDSKNSILKFFSWCTRINHQLCRGGDQTLYITKSLFENINGFNESYLIYEDNEFIQRIYKKNPFWIIPNQVITSARRYDEKGIIRLQWHYAMIHLRHYLGLGPKNLHRYYLKHVSNT